MSSGRGPTPVVIFGGDPAVGRILQLLLRSTGYDAKFVTDDSLGEPGLFDGVRLLLFWRRVMVKVSIEEVGDEGLRASVAAQSTRRAPGMVEDRHPGAPPRGSLSPPDRRRGGGERSRDARSVAGQISGIRADVRKAGASMKGVVVAAGKGARLLPLTGPARNHPDKFNGLGQAIWRGVPHGPTSGYEDGTPDGLLGSRS